MLEKLMKDEVFKKYVKDKINESIYINEKGCWVWNRSKRIFGYGVISKRIKDKVYQIDAHRASWVVYRGNIKKGLRVCHNCPTEDNPSCCNPEHLFLGTAKDNTRDMIRKGRDSFDFSGEKNNLAILTEKIVLEMRNLKKSGMKVSDIARKFNVKYFTCLDAVNGRNWTHI